MAASSGGRSTTRAPGNEHFMADYQLLTGGVVLVRVSRRPSPGWKALPETWNMTGDRKALARYLEEAIRSVPEGAGP